MTFFSEPEISGNPNLLYFGFCDPALGRKEGDYSALVTIAVDQNGIIYVVDAVIERLQPSAMKEVILQRAFKYEYVNLSIEDNGFQELFIDELRRESTRNNLYMPINGLTHSTNKKGRIESIQPLTHGSDLRPAIVRFRRDWEKAYPLLMKQLLQFPADEHDDAPDALEAAVSLARQSRTMDRDDVFIMGGAVF